MDNRKFRLFVPCGYAALYRIEGVIGGIPDVGLLGSQEKCWRSTLPPFLDNLVFNFAGMPDSNTIYVRNFYHLGDFFVVSNSMKDFLVENAGCEFEAKKIQTKHPRNEVAEQYWAMKVKTRFNCIIANESFAKNPSWSTEPPKSFNELRTELKLSEDMSPYFANKGADTYFSYPGYGVQSVSMDFTSVPSGVKFFEPMYWPQFLVIEKGFDIKLERQCTGGTIGYYFWTVGFDNVSNELAKTMQELR